MNQYTVLKTIKENHNNQTLTKDALKEKLEEIYK